jgi:hypothetical protein
LEQACVRWERRARAWRRAVACAFLAQGCILVGMSWGALVQAQVEGPEAGPKNDPSALVGDQVALCQRALETIARATVRGIPARNQPNDEYLWSLRRLQAKIFASLAAGEPKTEDPEVYLSLPGIKPSSVRLKAFEEHWLRMKRWETRLQGVVDRGAMSPLDFMSIEFHRLQAETWLAREQQKAKQAG